MTRLSVSVRSQASVGPDVIVHSSLYFSLGVKGYRVHTSIYVTAAATTGLSTPRPSALPSHTAAIDCGRGWVDQISYSGSMRLFNRAHCRRPLNAAFKQPAPPPTLPRAAPSSTLTVIDVLKAQLGIYSKCFSINIKKEKGNRKDSYIG